MANNKYENQFCFVASSTIISNCLFSDCIIAIYKVSSMSNNKVTFHTSIGIRYCHSGSWPCLSQIRIEIIHTTNATAITNATWNIALASTKQNDII